MDFFELIKSSIDVPLVAAMIFAFLQIIKQTKFPNKYIPLSSFIIGVFAGIIKLGMAGTLTLSGTGIFAILSSSFIYGAGAIAMWAVLNKTFTSVGESIEKAFSNAYEKTTGSKSFAKEGDK